MQISEPVGDSIIGCGLIFNPENLISLVVKFIVTEFIMNVNISEQAANQSYRKTQYIDPEIEFVLQEVPKSRFERVFDKFSSFEEQLVEFITQ